MTQPRPPDLVDEVIDGFARERPDLDGRAIAAACRMIHAGRVAEAHAERVLKPFGLNYTDLDVLGNLRRVGAPFELSPAELMRQAMISSGAMTTCLDRLERSGMLTRHVRPDDRRGRIVRLSQRGHDLIDQALTDRFGAATRACAAMTGDELDQLNRLLARIAAAFDADHR